MCQFAITQSKIGVFGKFQVLGGVVLRGEFAYVGGKYVRMRKSGQNSYTGKNYKNREKLWKNFKTFVRRDSKMGLLCFSIMLAFKMFYCKT